MSTTQVFSEAVRLSNSHKWINSDEHVVIDTKEVMLIFNLTRNNERP